jgi:hypothetical protein
VPPPRLPLARSLLSSHHRGRCGFPRLNCRNFSASGWRLKLLKLLYATHRIQIPRPGLSFCISIVPYSPPRRCGPSFTPIGDETRMRSTLLLRETFRISIRNNFRFMAKFAWDFKRQSVGHLSRPLFQFAIAPTANWTLPSYSCMRGIVVFTKTECSLNWFGVYHCSGPFTSRCFTISTKPSSPTLCAICSIPYRAITTTIARIGRVRSTSGRNPFGDNRYCYYIIFYILIAAIQILHRSIVV